MFYLSQLKKEDLAGKTCLLRINLDIKDPKKDSLRIDAIIPTIKFILENNGRPLILSHRGRPEGIDPKLSLESLMEIICKKIGLPFDSSQGSQLRWLENLRFDPREQANDENFAKELAGKGDIYINDDFATSHRASVSMVGITKFLPSYAGLLLEKEIKNLSKVMENPEKPLVIIIGGIKIDDKVDMIKHFIDIADYFLMGSKYEISNFKFQISNDLSKKIIFPEDYISENNQNLDIGPKAIEQYMKIISTAKTIIWNGPLGLFENPKYLEGSKKIAEAIIASKAFSVIGGGDTDQLLGQLGIKDGFSFVSTGGGAMLEFLSGKKLPAIEALDRANI